MKDLKYLSDLLSAIGGVRHTSPDALAVRMLGHFGSIEALLGASPLQWGTFLGKSQRQLQVIKAVAAIVARLQGRERLPVTDSFGAFEWFRPIVNLDQEVVVAAFLTSENRLIECKEIFRGTIDSSPAQPREILRSALLRNAAKLIVAHNHPSASTEPSEDDIHFTLQLDWAATMVGVPLLDHLIVGPSGQFFSFADARLLNENGFKPFSPGPWPASSRPVFQSPDD